MVMLVADIQCRAMQIHDLDMVCAIEQQVQYAPWTAKQFAESLEKDPCWVIATADQVLGFCIIQTILDEANLLLMAIRPDQQGKGLGFQLLSYAIEQLGDTCVQIFLEVRESNLAAIKLYEKIGFHQIDIRKNYYPLPNHAKENAVIMVKTLDESAFFQV